ncbi:molybdate ABC transporter substrate-binding protein [Pseudarthrobacter sulfonivorans]|uniref:molybdate ABC transporter substrate-binding protein n=1 Tax=Pseudarthrobacter sulfonivorans TaxID=121292 RepID=UPI0021055BA3|nr:substrate-binding domain-containing protein [Pseudarthrobacter sulfonivorans]
MNTQAASHNTRPLSLFCAFALKQAVEHTILPAYAKAGGPPVEAVFEPTFRLLTRIKAGARPDVIVGITGALADLAAADIVRDARPVARTGVGVAVPPDAPVPDISTVEAFISAVTGARSVAYSRSGPSGIYFAGLLERLGIAEQVAPRATVIDSGPTAAALLDGRAAAAIHQLSELILVPEAKIVGPLPEAIQEYTNFASALGPASQAAEAAELRDFLHGPEARTAYAANGLEVSQKKA